MTAKTTAATIRTSLRNAFPAHTFSVTSHRGGQFDAVRIEWAGGPERASIKAIADTYATSNTFVFYDRAR
jgi:hypothetical protein